jgi:hypothetical protein
VTTSVEEAAAVKVAKEATVVKAAKEVTALKVPAEAMAVMGPDGSCSCGPNAVQLYAREAPDMTSNPKAVGKRPRIYFSFFLFTLHPSFMTLACTL